MHSRFPWVINTASTLCERCELFGAGHRESWIARRNGHDDIASVLTLVYPVAHLLGGRNSFRSAVIGNAGFVERGQEARVGAGIGVYRRCQANRGGQDRKHDKRSHGFILVQIDVVVAAHITKPEANMTLRMNFRDTHTHCEHKLPPDRAMGILFSGL